MDQQFNIQPLSQKLKDVVDQNDRFYTDPLSNDLLRGELLHHSETHFDQDKTNTEDTDDFKYHKATFLELKHNNNYEDKINNTEQNEQLLSSDKHNISQNGKHKNASNSHRIQLLTNKFNQLQLTKHHIIMIILNILMILTLLIVSQFLKRSSFKVLMDVEEILVMKIGDPYGGPGGEELWDDAEKASLTFNDTIIRITASQSVNLAGEPLLLSLTFGYSNDRIGKEYGGIGRHGRWDDLNPLELTSDERIDHITIYEGYRNITNSWREGKLTYIIVGIYFKTDHNQEILYGSTNGIRKEESPKNYFLAYAQGKAVGHIDSLRFIWYKYSLKNATILEANNQ